MTPAHLRTLTELVEAFVPAADAERIAGLASEALIRSADPSQVAELRLILRLLENPLVNGITTRRWQAFRDLSLAERQAVLLSWADSSIQQRRAAFHAFRRLATFLAYADPGEAGAPNP